MGPRLSDSLETVPGKKQYKRSKDQFLAGFLVGFTAGAFLTWVMLVVMR